MSEHTAALRILREQRDRAIKDLDTAKVNARRARTDADAAEDLVAIYQDTVDDLEGAIVRLSPEPAFPGEPDPEGVPA